MHRPWIHLQRRLRAAPVLALTATSLFLATTTSTMAQQDELMRLSWLAGCWMSTTGEAGSGETWTSPAGGTLLGISRTVKRGQTVAHEFMQIRANATGTLVLIAEPSGQRRTEFVLLSLSDTEVVFENLQHDFPHRVAYRLEPPDLLRPRIEGQRNGQPRVLEFAPLRRLPCAAP